MHIYLKCSAVQYSTVHNTAGDRMKDIYWTMAMQKTDLRVVFIRVVVVLLLVVACVVATCCAAAAVAATDVVQF